MSSLVKKIIASLVLLSFMVIALFSFTIMMHKSNERMFGDCPFSTMSASLCPQNIVAIVFHHISAYQSFINVPVGAGLTALIFALLFAICAVIVIFIRLPLLEPLALARVLYNFPSTDSYSKKIIHWLSLLENSPSFLHWA